MECFDDMLEICRKNVWRRIWIEEFRELVVMRGDVEKKGNSTHDLPISTAPVTALSGPSRL
jgi:hypothetical protein